MHSIEQFELIFNSSPIPTVLFSPSADPVFLAVNDAFLQTSSRSRGELLGTRLFASFSGGEDPASAPHVAELRESIAQAIATGKSQVMQAQRYPIKLTNPAGEEVYEERYWHAVNTPVFDAAGQLAGVLHHTTDITRQVRAEAQSRESAQRVQLATKAAGLGIWSWDAVNDIAVWENDRMYELMGIPGTEEPINTERFLAEFIHPDDVQPYRQALAETLESGKRFHFEGRFYRGLDKALRWFEFTGLLHYDAHDKPLRMVGTAADITQRKQTLEQLRIREERYKALFDSIDEAFCIVEVIFDEHGKPVDHRFVETNPAYEKHTGLSNVVDKRAREIAPDVEQKWNELYGQVATTGQSVRRVQYAEPLKRWFDVFISKLHGEADHKIAVLFRDITAQKHSDEELRQLAADLAKANQRQNEFLATLAHELRNPLAPIRTGLDLMRMSADKPAAAAKVREMMERQVIHLVHLVDDLLDLARINSGKIELKKSHVLLKDVILSAVETALPGFQAKRHDFNLQVPDEPIWLDADAHRLAQVVGNVLTNAAKYTPQGGQIGLRVRQEGGTVAIEIQDNGIGIPAEALPGIFDMFNQVGRDKDYAQGGLGIGLNLVKRLTEKHGGKVSVTSAGKGQGSTFTIVLPTSTPETNQPQVRRETVFRPSGTQAPRPLTILIADDNQDAADMLRQILEMNGDLIHVVHNGPEALEKARQFTPDLALLDIGMPGMTGYELAERMRKEPALRNTVLVAITGWGAQEDRNKSRESGFDHHLTKPVDFAALNSLVDKIRFSLRSNDFRKSAE